MNLPRTVFYSGFSKKDYLVTTQYPVFLYFPQLVFCVILLSLDFASFFLFFPVTFRLFTAKHCFHNKSWGGAVLRKIVLL